jgi:hypothetical protein
VCSLPRVRERDREGAPTKIRACSPPSPTLPRKRGREETELAARVASCCSRGCCSRQSHSSCIHFVPPLQTADLVPAARFLRPGFALPLHSPRFMGWAERRESSGACEAPVGPALSGQARRLARRLASPYGGRSPPGAPPWRFSAPVPRFPHRHSRRIGHSELLAPGRSARWRPPRPPGAAVMSRYRRTPLLAPHSGSSREHAPNERGCESLWWPLFAVKCKQC